MENAKSNDTRIILAISTGFVTFLIRLACCCLLVLWLQARSHKIIHV